MAANIPSIQDAQQKYAAGTQANANTWASRTAQAAGAWEAGAKSPAAEQAYATGVQLAAQNQSRLRGLQQVSQADFAQAVSGKSGDYARGTQAAVGKWGARFQPYLNTIAQIAPNLAPRVPGDVAGNVQRRVLPLAEALHAQKMGGTGFSTGGGAAVSGFGAPVGTAPRMFG